MCGRFTLTSSPTEVADFFGAEHPEFDFDANYNVAPTTDILTIVETGEGRIVELMHWGLVPSWAKDQSIGSRMINARSETLAEKPSFKRAFARRRCIIAVNGFYEWQAVPGQKRKQPMYITRTDGQLLAFAGLWESWRPPDGSGPDGLELHSCTIVTCSANGRISPVHDRMPVILERDAWTRWLDVSGTSVDAASELLVPAADDVLGYHPVSTDVNRVAMRDAHLIEPLPEDQGDDEGQLRLL